MVNNGVIKVEAYLIEGQRWIPAFLLRRGFGGQGAGMTLRGDYYSLWLFC